MSRSALPPSSPEMTASWASARLEFCTQQAMTHDTCTCDGGLHPVLTAVMPDLRYTAQAIVRRETRAICLA
jgi:hypothetical protein